jgi:hypothetical protein
MDLTWSDRAALLGHACGSKSGISGIPGADQQPAAQKLRRHTAAVTAAESARGDDGGAAVAKSTGGTVTRCVRAKT